VGKPRSTSVDGISVPLPLAVMTRSPWRTRVVLIVSSAGGAWAGRTWL
jgi:hypothetical protein